jgi:uncharacterized protein (DUF58 family)
VSLGTRSIHPSKGRAFTSRRVVILLLGLSLLALAVTGSPIYSRLSYVWVLLLVGGWIWSLLALRGVQVIREATKHRAQMGEILVERFVIQNQNRLPRLWLEVHDQATLPGSRGSRVLGVLKGRQRHSYLINTPLVQRGVFSLGPTVLASGDPFGLFTVKQTLPSDSSLLVYPMMVDVRTFPSPAGLLSGGESLRRRTHQVTPNAAGVREYAPGDSMNRIHWASTARRDRLMVKEFELDPLAEVWIFVDGAHAVQAALPHSPSDIARPASLQHPPEKMILPPSTEEYTASIAVSLARYFLRRKRAVGMVCHGQSSPPQVLAPERGPRQLGKILEATALLRAEGDLPISGLVMAQAQHLPRGSTVILITPSTEREVAVTIEHLLRFGHRPVVVLLDAASFDGPQGTAALEMAIAGLGVPVCRVPCGADVGTALSIESSVVGSRNWWK